MLLTDKPGIKGVKGELGCGLSEESISSLIANLVNYLPEKLLDKVTNIVILNVNIIHMSACGHLSEEQGTDKSVTLGAITRLLKRTYTLCDDISDVHSFMEQFYGLSDGVIREYIQYIADLNCIETRFNSISDRKNENETEQSMELSKMYLDLNKTNFKYFELTKAPNFRPSRCLQEDLDSLTLYGILGSNLERLSYNYWALVNKQYKNTEYRNTPYTVGVANRDLDKYLMYLGQYIFSIDTKQPVDVYTSLTILSNAIHKDLLYALPSPLFKNILGLAEDCNKWIESRKLDCPTHQFSVNYEVKSLQMVETIFSLYSSDQNSVYNDLSIVLQASDLLVNN